MPKGGGELTLTLILTLTLAQVKLLMPKGGGEEDSRARLVMRVENARWRVTRGPPWAPRG